MVIINLFLLCYLFFILIFINNTIFFFTVPFCRYIILSVLSSFDVSPWLLLLAYLPTALLGSGLLLATICYISDTTEPDKRAWHLACLQTCVKIGLVIGTFTGPLIFQKLNYTKLFMIATLLCLLSLLYVIFMLPETVKNKSEVSFYYIIIIIVTIYNNNFWYIF